MVREFVVQNLSAVQLAAIAVQVSEKRDGAVAGGGAILGKSARAGASSLAGGSGGLLAGPDGKSILVIAPESRQEAWKDLLTSLDKRESVSVARYVPRYFEIKDVSRLIDQSIKPVGGGGGDDRFRVVEDDLTGSLLVTAMQHAQIVTLIEQLNAAPPDGRRPMKILKVRNRDVQEVLVVLQSLVTSGSLMASEDVNQSGRSTLPGGTLADGPLRSPASAPGAATAPGSPSAVPGGDSTPAILPEGYSSSRVDARPLRSGNRGRTPGAGSGNGTGTRTTPTADVVLTADQGTSSIIAVGEPWALAQVERLLKSLDVRQPQVMVQALVVSLNDSQSRKLGIELEGQINLSADSFLRLSSLFGLSTAGTQVGDRTSTGAGGTSLLLSPGEFAAVTCVSARCHRPTASAW